MTRDELNKFFGEMYVANFVELNKSNKSNYNQMKKIQIKYAKKYEDIYAKYYKPGQADVALESTVNIKAVHEDVAKITGQYASEVGIEVDRVILASVSTAYIFTRAISNYALSNQYKLKKVTDALCGKVENYLFLGKTIKQRLGKVYFDLDDRTGQIIINGLQNGQSSAVIAKSIKSATGRSYTDSLRIAITEENRVYNQGALEEMRLNANIEQIIIIATLDAITSEVCRDKDGNIYDIEKVTQDNIPPFHPHCRTTFGAYFSNKDFDRLDNITKQQIPYITYREWEKLNPEVVRKMF